MDTPGFRCPIRPLGAAALVAVVVAVLVACGGAPPGGGGPNPNPNPTPGSVDGLFLFAANDGVHGMEPWVTDGTPEGTRLLIDVVPGAGSSVEYGLDMQDEPSRWWVLADGAIVFLAEGPDGRGHAYRSDGTSSGTTRILADFIGLATLAEVGGNVVALGRASSTQEGLYRLDVLAGTATFLSDEPIVLADGFFGSVPGGVVGSVDADGTYYHFGFSDIVATDGTSGGTRTVHSYLQRCGARAYAQLSGFLYYGANDLVDVYDGDGFLIGQEPSGCRVWRHGVSAEPYRTIAPAEMYDFHARDGWVYAVMRHSIGDPRVLTAFDGSLPPATPGAADGGYVHAVDIGMSILWARPSRSGTSSIVHGLRDASLSLVSVSGSPNVPMVSVLDRDAGSVEPWWVTYVGDRIVFISRDTAKGTIALRRAGPTASSGATLLSGDETEMLIDRLMADPYQQRAFFWVTEYVGDPDPMTGDQRVEVSFWTTDGTPNGTRRLRTFCESDVGPAACEQTYHQ